MAGLRLLACAVLCCGGMFGGVITVTPSVTPNGALFHYDYTVTNTTGDDLAVLDIAVVPEPGTIQNLNAPAGFVTAFDFNLGLVSFLEDSSVFGSAPLDGFTFDSPFAPRATTFTGTLLDSGFNVFTESGSTSGPVAPEPAALPIFLAITGIVVLVRGRRRVALLN